MLSLSLILAVLADRILGEAPWCHPLVAFGRLANSVEARARKWAVASIEDSDTTAASYTRWQIAAGSLSWLVLILPPVLLLIGLQSLLSGFVAGVVGVAVLYFCIGGRSLSDHAQAVGSPLITGDLNTARTQLSRIVSRDTAHLDAESVAKATIESVLENGSDAILAPLFWFVIAGAPGVLCYRFTNTLDAMWGYRNEKYLYFGRAAARMDDILNWLPARICALCYALAGNWSTALRCWRTQAALCDSPNAGPVMSAGAGALGVVLGGTASYGSEPHWRPILGEGKEVAPVDISRAMQLVWRATGLGLLMVVVCELLLWL